MNNLVVRGGTLITMDAERRIIPGGIVVLEDDLIKWVGPAKDMRELSNDVEIIDATNKIVMPGLIDCHGHAGHGLTRTVGAGRTGEWEHACEIIYSQGSTEEFWRADGFLAALERLKFGVTCGVTYLGGGGTVLTGDMVMRTDVPAYGAKHCEAVNQVGIREYMAVGPRRSPFPHQYTHWHNGRRKDVMVHFKDHLDTCEQLIEDWHDKVDKRIKVCLMSQTYHPDLAQLGSTRHRQLVDEIQSMFAIAKRHNLLFTQDGHTTGTIKFAHDELDILGPSTFLSHATNLTAADIEASAATDTRIVHNPSANASILGRCPVPELLDAGVTVVLGSDGLGPDRSCDMFRHMFHCMRYHRRHFQDVSYLPSGKVLEMVTIDAARALGVDHMLGSLEIGKKADLILVDTMKPHLSPLLMPVDQVTNFANGNDVDTVIVDGEILMQGRKVQRVDEAEVLNFVQRTAEETFDRVQLRDLLTPKQTLWRHSKA